MTATGVKQQSWLEAWKFLSGCCQQLKDFTHDSNIIPRGLSLEQVNKCQLICTY
jgi:hypothetical protein